ncbi:MAG: hypothetical protein ACI4F5_00180 [Acutalibacteraceae bacterium]
MDIHELEKRIMRLQSRGIVTKFTSSQIICAFDENEKKREVIEKKLAQIEKLNDEDPEFFNKLNQLINEMIY